MALYDLLIKSKTASILVALKDPNLNWHLSKIARETKTTYVFVTHMVKLFNQEGLVSLEVKGKKKIVKLTEKGVKLANLFDQIRETTKVQQVIS
jgi:predicted transcriptional regulator